MDKKIKERNKLCIIYDYLSTIILNHAYKGYPIILNYACKGHHLVYSAAHYHKKAHVKFMSDGYKIEGEKMKKSHKVCIN